MLKKLLYEMPNDASVWQIGNLKYSKKNIISFIEKNYSTVLKQFHNKTIILHISNQIVLSHLLVLFDGMVKRIILIPEEFDLSSKNLSIENYKVDYLINDHLDYPSLQNVGIIIEASIFFENIPLNLKATESCNSFLSTDILNTQWVLATSGTTGIPKLISHTRASLTRTTKQNFEKGSSFAWALMYQIARFAGLQVFLQSFSGGSKLIFLNSGSIKDNLEELIKAKCNAISATPTMFRKLLMGSNFSDLDLKQITLGGEISDQKLLDMLKNLFPAARITQVYASTEAGVGFAVNDGFAGFPESFLGENLKGVKIKISNDNILMLKNSKSNDIKGNNFSIPRDQDNFIESGDVVEYKNGRYFFLGRSNGAINVGGNKVHPEEIENVINELSEIEMVSVFSKKNPILGNIVAAKIVPSGNFDEKKLKLLISSHCKKTLDDYKVPITIKIVQTIEVNKSGKMLRV